MQDVWTEHMRGDLDTARTSALIASALALDPEPPAEPPHAVDNIPPTVLENIEPPTDDNSATCAGCPSSTPTPSPEGRAGKKSTRRSKSSALTPADLDLLRASGLRVNSYIVKPGNPEVAKMMQLTTF